MTLCVMSVCVCFCPFIISITVTVPMYAICFCCVLYCDLFVLYCVVSHVVSFVRSPSKTDT